jgi:tetratricopeptide (TPR) repeat protein
MSAPCRARKKRTAVLSVLLVLVLGLLPSAGGAQTVTEAFAQGRELYKNGNYAEAERRFKRALTLGPATAELHYLLGMCAAFQGRFDEAEAALSAAIGVDPFFAEAHVEIGGLFFKQKRFGESAKALRKALRLDPGNAYARDLLGTVYFINGSQEPALEEWNKVAKPVLKDLIVAGDGIARPELLRRELRVRPGQIIRPSAIEESTLRLAKVDCFSRISFALQPSPDRPDQADLLVTGREERGFGPSPAAVAVGGLRDILHETAYLDFKNISRRGINLYGTYRWDPGQKMAEFAVRAARLLGTPFYYRLGYRDGRDRWFFGASDALGEDEEFTLTEREVRLDADYVLDHRTSLGHHIGIKRASYLRVSGGMDEAPETRFVWGGDYAYRLMERRASGLAADLRLRYDFFRPIGVEAKTFVRSVLSATVEKTWTRGMSPEAAGCLTGRVNGGLSSTQTPFDEWFVLGIGPGVEFPLRAFRTTRDGKLGASPLGRKFVLMNLDYLHGLGRLLLARIDGGVFFDVGRAFGGEPYAGESGASWMTDCGVRLVARLFHVAFQISYAHSLKDGRRAFYISSRLD